MRVVCIGAGYVGGPTMAVMAVKCPDIDFTVIDSDPARIAAWNDPDTSGLPIYEPGLPAVIEAARAQGNLAFTSDGAREIAMADILFVAVNTPTKECGVGAGRAADMANYELAARRIARICASPLAREWRGRARIVVEKSTIPVRTAASLKRVLLESPGPSNDDEDEGTNGDILNPSPSLDIIKEDAGNHGETDAIDGTAGSEGAGRNGGSKEEMQGETTTTAAAATTTTTTTTTATRTRCRFEIVSNPEFLAEGTAIADLLSPDRVLVGGGEETDGASARESSAWAVDTLVEIYARWVPRERIVTTSLWSGELAKLVANAFLAQRVSSINAVSAICEATGANVGEVARVVGMDARIGNRFLSPSLGFGGSCFKKDILNLVYLCEKFNLQQVADYWNSVVEINEWQKRRFSRTIVSAMFDSVRGKDIAVLGYAFKKDTGDTRETPALDVVASLVHERARVRIYDPRVPPGAPTREVTRAIESMGRTAACNFNSTAGGRGNENAAAKSAREIVAECVTECADPYAAIGGSHAIVILTEWDEFSRLDYARAHASMRHPAFVFDGRRVVDAEALRAVGFQVYVVGQPGDVAPEVR